jgi:hypothetical protein
LHKQSQINTDERDEENDSEIQESIVLLRYAMTPPPSTRTVDPVA